MKPTVRPTLTPPRNLAARHIVVDGEELLILEFPLPVPHAATILTETERAVALMAVSGKSTRDIAKERRRSPRTIAHQLDAIYRKLGVKSRVELACALLRTADEA
jgi:DNA-binding NarL/FixJ family response regulator